MDKFNRAYAKIIAEMNSNRFKHYMIKEQADEMLSGKDLTDRSILVDFFQENIPGATEDDADGFAECWQNDGGGLNEFVIKKLKISPREYAKNMNRYINKVSCTKDELLSELERFLDEETAKLKENYETFGITSDTTPEEFDEIVSNNPRAWDGFMTDLARFVKPE